MNRHGCAILGMGYLGRPLAEKLFESGREVAAMKRNITSDDVNLPIRLDAVDLNQSGQFQTACLNHWADKPVWICLLPPSAVADYLSVLTEWITAAKQCGVAHIVYGSSIGVYGGEARICDERSPLNPQTASSQKVAAAEQLFLNSGMANIDILRLGGLYSAERHPLNSLLKRQQNGGAHQPVNVLHQGRAVAALYQAVNGPNGIRIRNIVETQYPPKYEFYRAEALKLGLPEADFDMADVRGGKVVQTAFDDFLNVLA